MRECPFCRHIHPRGVVHQHEINGCDAYVECRRCGSRGPTYHSDDPAAFTTVCMNEAVARWDRRDPA